MELIKCIFYLIQIHGYGIYKWKSGNIYEGEWKDNKYNGKGIYKWKNGNILEC